MEPYDIDGFGRRPTPKPQIVAFIELSSGEEEEDEFRNLALKDLHVKREQLDIELRNLGEGDDEEGSNDHNDPTYEFNSVNNDPELVRQDAKKTLEKELDGQGNSTPESLGQVSSGIGSIVPNYLSDDDDFTNELLGVDQNEVITPKVQYTVGKLTAEKSNTPMSTINSSAPPMPEQNFNPIYSNVNQTDESFPMADNSFSRQFSENVNPFIVPSSPHLRSPNVLMQQSSTPLENNGKFENYQHPTGNYMYQGTPFTSPMAHMSYPSGGCTPIYQSHDQVNFKEIIEKSCKEVLKENLKNFFGEFYEKGDEMICVPKNLFESYKHAAEMLSETALEDKHSPKFTPKHRIGHDHDLEQSFNKKRKSNEHLHHSTAGPSTSVKGSRWTTSTVTSGSYQNNNDDSDSSNSSTHTVEFNQTSIINDNNFDAPKQSKYHLLIFIKFSFV